MADQPKNEGGPFDAQTVRFLAGLMSRHDLNEIDLRDGGRRIRLLRGGPVVTPHPVAYAPGSPAPAAPPPTSAAPPAEKPARNLIEIKSEGIGIFFAQPKAGAEPYVRIGSRVQPDTVVGLVEAMKLFSEVTAGCSGVITEILVKNEEPVEYDQVLFRVDPTG